VGGRRTHLFCAWLAWSRYRVVLPNWDRKLGTLLACLDATLRRLGGAPTYLLTDNERTVTTDRVAGVAVRHPVLVTAGRHYGPRGADLRGGGSRVEGRLRSDRAGGQGGPGTDRGPICSARTAVFRSWSRPASGSAPKSTLGTSGDQAAAGGMLSEERNQLHLLPVEPYTVSVGETRSVEDDQTVRYGSVRYSTPPGWVGQQVWCRVEGEELSSWALVSRASRRCGVISCRCWSAADPARALPRPPQWSRRDTASAAPAKRE